MLNVDSGEARVRFGVHGPENPTEVIGGLIIQL